MVSKNGLLLGGLLLGFTPIAQAVHWDNYLTLTTNYLSKAVTNSENNPAVQGQLKLILDQGFYGSIWASNIKFNEEPDAKLEVDLALGYTHQIKDIDFDLGYVYYAYPGATQLAFGDAYIGAHYHHLAAIAYLTDNVSNQGKFGAFYHASYDWHLPALLNLPTDQLTLTPGLGYYQRPTVAGSSYSEYDINLSHTHKNIDFILAYAHAEGGRLSSLDENSLYFKMVFHFA